MDLFGRKAKKELVETKAALKQCSEKLVEKQEHINQTNAYWKKQMYAKSKKKEL
jgi:hypothetical protein